MTLPSLDSLQLLSHDGGRIWALQFHHGRANEIGRQQIHELERLVVALQGAAATALISHSERRTVRGTPVFVAGADVREREDWSDAQVLDHVSRQRDVMVRLAHIPQFHVAVVAGAALGWGLEYLLACDYVLVTPSARLALPETNLGIVPGAGGTGRLAARVGVAAALRLGMTGEELDGAEAVRLGLAQELLPDQDAALARAFALARRTTTRSPTAMASFKWAVRSAEPALDVEARAYTHCVRSGEARRGREAFARDPAVAQAWSARTPVPSRQGEETP